MIKEGDIFICTKRDYIYWNGKLSLLDCVIGERYIVQYVVQYASEIVVTINGWLFNIYKTDDTCTRKFSDYFISLVDWREQQMKSVLDD